MAALHVVNRPEALAGCVAVAAERDTILLIEDGVYAAIPDHPKPAFLVLDDDAHARGIDPRAGMERISYRDFVELVATHQPVVSW
jgi:sulfur relay protein TusB/DsrH